MGAHTYPFAWFGILADVQPSTDELIYAWHPDGFAFHSMRSESVSRLYLQVPPDTDPVTWSDDQIWEALARRLGHGQNVIGRGQRRAGRELRGPADVHIRHVRRGRPGRPR
jgi:2-polyprenyl-6-methoxyphenol hydroxylase-like FAD-dependent oxidoreductase